MCTATSRGPQLQNLENLYRCEEPQKEEFREFDIYFLIENNNYQQMHYTKSVKTLWNTTCVCVCFFFFFFFFFLYQAFGLPRVHFINCRQFMYLVISHLVLRAGYGI